MTVPTTTLVELWQTLVETLEMWHTLVLLAGFVASQRFPSGSTGSVATLSSAAWVLFAGGPVARWRNGDAPLFLASSLAPSGACSRSGTGSRSVSRYPVPVQYRLPPGVFLPVGYPVRVRHEHIWVRNERPWLN